MTLEQEKDTRKKHSQKTGTVLEDIFCIGLKMLYLTGFLFVMFTFVFGIYRCSDAGMNPGIKGGDLLLYYRKEKQYRISDTVILEKEGKVQARRIIAVPGDTVDITEKGLMINGYLQQEKGIYTETVSFLDGIQFPITVGENEYFVLGDNRAGAEDSRIYGTVNQKEIKGIAITLFRRRGL